jgi:N-acyl-D-aspartate/D-glutamate deacylase
MMPGFDRNASQLGTNRLCLVVLLVCVVGAACSQSQQYDLVINGGRVIDPETSLDAVRSVGIVGDRIARVSAQPLKGTKVIDATGLVVSPGFIDLHQHDQSPAAYRLKALDGVTSALEMESGVPDFAKFVAVREGKALINYGATVSQEAARVLAFDDTLATSVMGEAGSIDDPPAGPATNNVASDEQIARQLAFLDRGLTAGALGVGMGLEYTPGATRLEIIRIFQEAAKWHRPVFVHMRSVGALEPGSSVESLGEMIAASAVSGAPVHIVHINSSCIRFVRDCLTMIEGARARGLDITTEAYPYGAGMTSIASALFNPGWRERRSIGYDAIELPETGERLTQTRFDALHASGKAVYVLIHMNPDSIVAMAATSPLTMIASDGLSSHPRQAGTYSRVLARYVREEKSLSLMDAIRKMSLLPALRLETVTASAHRKGRLQEGADADIVVFDPATVADKATYRAPLSSSVGMKHVLVRGTPVVRDGQVVDGAAPGKAITADLRAKP